MDISLLRFMQSLSRYYHIIIDCIMQYYRLITRFIDIIDIYVRSDVMLWGTGVRSNRTYISWYDSFHILSYILIRDDISA